MSVRIAIPGGEAELLHDGFMYISRAVGENNCSAISKVNLTTLTVTSWLNSNTVYGNTSAIPFGLNGMVIYENYMYAVNTFNRTIVKISLGNSLQTVEIWYTGLATQNEISGYTGLVTPFDIKEYNGYFYVTEFDSIVQINIATKTVTKRWVYPQSSKGYFMLLKDNYLYIPLPESNTIYRLDVSTPNNELELFLENFGTVSPQSICIINDNLFIVAQYGGGIFRVNLQTNKLAFWNSLPCGQIVCDANYLYLIGNGGFNRYTIPNITANTDYFFIDDPFTISQTSNIFSQILQPPSTTDYDYILDINIKSHWDSMNDLFSERRFMTEANQGDNSEMYNIIHLNVNREKVANLFESANSIIITSDKTAVTDDYQTVYNTLDPDPQLIGFRFLEIVATKIFGHAKTKIAIENTNDYYTNDYNDDYNVVNSLIGQIAWGVFNSIINKKFNIMNDYVETDRIQDNAHGASLYTLDDYPYPFINFNFNDTVWEFPIIFRTVLASTGGSDIEELNNGPLVGGRQLINGVVNVPILLRFRE